MRELCVSSFRGSELVSKSESKIECDFDTFEGMVRAGREKGTHAMLVASRNRPASLFMDPAVLRSNPDIGVIWMLRNPLDVLTSVHKRQPGFYVPPYRLIASLNLYNYLKNEPGVLTVRYEDLVSKPQAVQNEIAGKFGLDPVRPFTESHQLFPAQEQSLSALHSIRPIDSDSVNKWKKNPEFARYLSKVLREYHELIPLAAACGYNLNTEALASALEPVSRKTNLKGLARAAFSRLGKITGGRP